MTSTMLIRRDFVADTRQSAPWRQLGREMLQHSAAAKSKLELLQGLANCVCRCVPTLAIVYVQRNEQGELSGARPIHVPRGDGQAARCTQQLLPACQRASRQGEVEIEILSEPARVLIALPVPQQGQDPEALGLIFSASEVSSQLLLLVQSVVSQIVLWQVLVTEKEAARRCQDIAALVELLERVSLTPGRQEACQTLVSELQTHLGCRRAAIGWSATSGGRCRLTALSGVAQFDKHSQSTMALEAVLDETILRGELTRWPPGDDAERHSALAHQRLSSLEQGAHLVSLALRNSGGQLTGALLLLFDAPESADVAQRFLQAAQHPLAAVLQVVSRAEGGWLVRQARVVAHGFRSLQGRIALVLAFAAVLALAIPFPHRLHCDCLIEPVTRRFVAAPFDGVLERALVGPGDVVQQGDLLARLDGREIRWKRAGVAADQNQARKKRDAAQASHDYADMQIAALEMERLELELRLLDHRAENLEIRSPVAGVIASGDLERAEGAALKVGQSLFEIAPLDKMIVEVSVPDEDVSFITAGLPLQIRLDAYPGMQWQATMTQLHPRSEIRDENNVFITEAELDNADGRLRPGMKGRARIETTQRPIGWLLFHKPWEFISKKLQW